MKFFSILKQFECFWICRFFRSETDFSEESRKISHNNLGKSSNAFYARRLPTKSSRSLLPKVIQILDMYFVCVYLLDSKKSYRFNLIWFFFYYLSIKKLFLSFLYFEVIWMFLNMQIFYIWVRLWKTSQKTLGRLSEDFLGKLLMHFMQ